MQMMLGTLDLQTEKHQPFAIKRSAMHQRTVSPVLLTDKV